MWFIESLADTFGVIKTYFENVAEAASSIWVVGGTLEDLFNSIAGFFGSAEVYLDEVDAWADDVMAQLGQILSWDTIKEYIQGAFPIVKWSPWEIIDDTWSYLTDKLKLWFEDQEDWLFDIGARILAKLL